MLSSLLRGSLERRLVWILGSPRSGSTWLLGLLTAHPRIGGIDEPGIGVHLGISVESVNGLRSERETGYRLLDMRGAAPDYFFAEAERASWEAPLRTLLLTRLGAHRAGNRWLVIKEPHGGDAADLLLSALPNSRVIFLVRDGRDVTDSELDAASEGSWAMDALPGYEPAQDRLDFLESRSLAWVRRTKVVRHAYEDHAPEKRRLIRYEDLLADTPGVLAELAAWLGVGSDEMQERARAARAADQPADRRGPGRFLRSARPGAWRDNLSDDEQATVTRIMEPTLRDLGYAVR